MSEETKKAPTAFVIKTDLILSVIFAICAGIFVLTTILALLNPSALIRGATLDQPKISFEKERKPLEPITCMRIDEESNIYVFYCENNMLNVYDVDGRFLYSIVAKDGSSNGGNDFALYKNRLYMRNKGNTLYVFQDAKLTKTYQFHTSDYSYTCGNRRYTEEQIEAILERCDTPDVYEVEDIQKLYLPKEDTSVMLHKTESQVYYEYEGHRTYIVKRPSWLWLTEGAGWYLDAIMFAVMLIIKLIYKILGMKYDMES